MATKQDDPEKVTDASIKSVQEQSDKETEQGFAGTAVDPTPRENYTVSGVTSGAPTPETDESAAADAAKAVRQAR